jgi:ABC-type branched-subunit amino acid transport system ATPase component
MTISPIWNRRKSSPISIRYRPRADDQPASFDPGAAPLIRQDIWNCLSMLKARGQSVLVIDKNVEHLTRICDRRYIIERGRAVWNGTSEQLIAEQ